MNSEQHEPDEGNVVTVTLERWDELMQLALQCSVAVGLLGTVLVVTVNERARPLFDLPVCHEECPAQRCTRA
jgi:hypothetical protein